MSKERDLRRARSEPNVPIGAGVPDSPLEQAITAVSHAVFPHYSDWNARERLVGALTLFAAEISGDGA